jgi:hypothetical protein
MDYEKLGVFYLGRLWDADAGERLPEPLLYDGKDLTTHAVIVGMTGSGKTGLAVGLLEEAAIDGVPAIVIDPKGDMGNLLLAFPDLAPAAFRPWIDEGEAARAGLEADTFAAKTAERWKAGLAEWGQPPERIARYREAVELAIYTPGSTAGAPISVLRSFAAPGEEVARDADALRERVVAVVSGLLGLLGIDADPLRSREHILVSRLLHEAWTEGKSLDLGALIHAIQRPPFERIGVLDLETFYPAKDRGDLALRLNGLLASPGFAAWTEGEPLDIQRLLWTPEGKPRVSVLSIAHLGDAERMFFVTMLLNEVVAWMRAQPGTSSLRAILYMDEVFGYFPPTANPPSKTPMLTLLKQARAFGLGVTLATQNPVDLDYKGLSNAGTWFLGRLQTERDKERVLAGLEGASAAAGKGFDRARYGAILSGLGKRVFLLNNVHEEAPVLFQTRWALSYLRGPLTRTQIQTLTKPREAPSRPAPVPRTAPSAGPRPAVPAEVREAFFVPGGLAGAVRYRPALFATAKLHHVDAKAKLDLWREVHLLAPLAGGAGPEWDQATTLERAPVLSDRPLEAASFGALPAEASRAKSYPQWEKELASTLYRTGTLAMFRCAPLKLVSAPGESEGDFRVRVRQASREKRDAGVEALRKKYAERFRRLEDEERRVGERIAREEAQYRRSKVDTALSMGATIFGAFLGRKSVGVGTLGRATTAARGVGRAQKEKRDVEQAAESLEAVRRKRSDLEFEVQQEIERIHADESDEAAVEPFTVAPRKADIAVEGPVLVWVAEPVA